MKYAIYFALFAALVGFLDSTFGDHSEERDDQFIQIVLE